jgi:hypothetical protein
MKRDRKLIHVGIDYIVSPCPALNPQTRLSFQQSILDSGLEYTNTTEDGNKFIVFRQPPSHLEITVIALNPPHIGQLLVVSEDQNRPLNVFCDDAEAAVQAFHNNWPLSPYQIMGCDICIRELHETTSDHAFKELWEDHLHQPSESLSTFNRPILGGGLRFIANSPPGEHPTTRYDIKIESFIDDSKKVFIEVQLFYIEPLPLGEPFSPSQRLLQVNQFIENQVYSFMKGVLVT